MSMMRPARSTAGLLAAGLLATGLAAGLAGCSSNDEPTPDPTQGGSSEVLPPIMVDGPGTVDAKVGEVIVVSNEEVTRVETDNPSVLDVSQPTTTDGTTYSGAAIVVDDGEASLTVFAGDEELYTVEVIAEYGEAIID